MFKINQIDETHLRFYGYYDTHVKYNFDSYKTAIENYKNKINDMSFGTMKGGLFPINLSDISHAIEDVDMDDNGMVCGTLKILDTPNGRILKEICNKCGTQNISVVPVGTGKINDDKETTDIEIITFNIQS